MTKEPTLLGFIARLQAKSNSEKLSFMELKYIEAMEKLKKKGGEQWMD